MASGPGGKCAPAPPFPPFPVRLLKEDGLLIGARRDTFLHWSKFKVLVGHGSFSPGYLDPSAPRSCTCLSQVSKRLAWHWWVQQSHSFWLLHLQMANKSRSSRFPGIKLLSRELIGPGCTSAQVNQTPSVLWLVAEIGSGARSASFCSIQLHCC